MVLRCPCGGVSNVATHRRKIRAIQRAAKVSFETAKYMMAATLLIQKGYPIPDNFGPVTTRYDENGACHVDVDESITTNKPSTTARATLRDAIKSGATKTQAEDDKSAPEVENPDDQSNTSKQEQKNKGKSKTFKRKTKRPGRV